MNKLIVFLTSAIFCLNIFAQTNPDVINYKEHINKDSLYKNVDFLQSFGSRFTCNDNRKEIATELKDKLVYYGWNAKIDSFYLDKNTLAGYLQNKTTSGWQYNVIAEKKGSNESEIIVLGAHYDSFSNYGEFDNTPGADDNASGVSAILEIARIYQKNNLTPLRTIRIEFYAAEEIGLCGSKYAASKSIENRDNIVAMINLDMIGYNAKSQDNWRMYLVKYDNSNNLTDFCENTIRNYSSITPVRTTDYNQFSDSWSYVEVGKKAIFIAEDSLNNPFYHSRYDLLSNIDLNYFTEMSKIVFALTYLTANTSDFASIHAINKETPRINFFEQPSKNKIRFHYNSSSINKDILRLYDCFGRTVLNKPLKSFLKSDNNFEIETYNLKSGYYILNIVSDKYTASEKVIIVK